MSLWELTYIALGSTAIFWPQIMGNGYDTILSSANGELRLQLLIALVFAKTIASAISAGVCKPILLIKSLIYLRQKLA